MEYVAMLLGLVLLGLLTAGVVYFFGSVLRAALFPGRDRRGRDREAEAQRPPG